MITNFYFGTVKVNIMFGLLYGYAVVRVTFTYFVDRVTKVAQFGASVYTLKILLLLCMRTSSDMIRIVLSAVFHLLLVATR